MNNSFKVAVLTAVAVLCATPSEAASLKEKFQQFGETVKVTVTGWFDKIKSNISGEAAQERSAKRTTKLLKNLRNVREDIDGLMERLAAKHDTAVNDLREKTGLRLILVPSGAKINWRIKEFFLGIVDKVADREYEKAMTDILARYGYYQVTDETSESYGKTIYDLDEETMAAFDDYLYGEIDIEELVKTVIREYYAIRMAVEQDLADGLDKEQVDAIIKVVTKVFIRVLKLYLGGGFDIGSADTTVDKIEMVLNILESVSGDSKLADVFAAIEKVIGLFG